MSLPSRHLKITRIAAKSPPGRLTMPLTGPSVLENALCCEVVENENLAPKVFPSVSQLNGLVSAGLEGTAGYAGLLDILQSQTFFPLLSSLSLSS